MDRQPSRRDFVCGLGTLSIVSLAGCAAESPRSADTPRQSLYVRAINETAERQSLGISVVDGDQLLFQQDLKLPAIQQKAFADAATLVSLGEIPEGKQVTVKAVLHGEQTQRASTPLTLDCITEDKRDGNSVSVIIQEEGSITVTNEVSENVNSCFRGTLIPSDGNSWNRSETDS
jgi:hypothetical protein